MWNRNVSSEHLVLRGPRVSVISSSGAPDVSSEYCTGCVTLPTVNPMAARLINVLRPTFTLAIVGATVNSSTKLAGTMPRERHHEQPAFEALLQRGGIHVAVVGGGCAIVAFLLLSLRDTRRMERVSLSALQLHSAKFFSTLRDRYRRSASCCGQRTKSSTAVLLWRGRWGGCMQLGSTRLV